MNAVFSLTTLLLLAAMGLAILRIQGKKELANALAKRLCNRNELQFLDGTVSFRGIHLAKPYPQIVYRFNFEYSVYGSDRHGGSVSLIGQRIQTFYINPDHMVSDEIKRPEICQN